VSRSCSHQLHPNRASLPSAIEPTTKSRRSRRLALETLESRLALSTVDSSSLDPCPSLQAEPAIVESGGTMADSIVGDSPFAEQSDHDDFVGPLEADAYFESIQATESTVFVAEGEAQPNVAPTLLSFEAVRIGNYWLLSGTVIDDLVPSNCRVYFDGVLNGQSATVMPDGSFWHYTYYDPELTTIVNAVARDSQGNESNMMSAVLPS